MIHKALFLDRDGVINVDHGYVYRPTDFAFVPGIFELCRRFQASDFKLVVVTNQSGIGRGYYTEADFWLLTEWMMSEFKQREIEISAVYFCPHHPDKALGDYKQSCDCRKPKPGMLFQAQQDLNLDLSQSALVGDKMTDIQAANEANLARAFLFEQSDRQSQLSSRFSYQKVGCLDEIRPNF